MVWDQKLRSTHLSLFRCQSTFFVASFCTLVNKEELSPKEYVQGHWPLLMLAIEESKEQHAVFVPSSRAAVASLLVLPRRG